MDFTPLTLPGLFVVSPEVHNDDRGYFFRFFDGKEFIKAGLNKPWVQLNHSFTKKKGTIRGMHFQQPPYGEVKLVKCIRGKILDIAIDLRRDSPCFLKWEAVELSEENRKMLFIPEGFAHGFQALDNDCELIYHHSAPYVKESEGGIRWNDPLIGIKWPMSPVHVSERDNNHPLLTKEFPGIKIS